MHVPTKTIYKLILKMVGVTYPIILLKTASAHSRSEESWLFFGSPKGARASAAAYGVIKTCKANKIDAYKYLIYLFKHLPTLPLIRDPGLIDGYLPWSTDIQNNCK